MPQATLTTYSSPDGGSGGVLQTGLMTSGTRRPVGGSSSGHGFRGSHTVVRIQPLFGQPSCSRLRLTALNTPASSPGDGLVSSAQPFQKDPGLEPPCLWLG